MVRLKYPRPRSGTVVHLAERERKVAERSANANDERSAASASAIRSRRYTSKQGQYLSFIHYYTKVHGVPPAEADLQRYFKVSAPAVHQMIVTLGARGFIERVPGTARSIRLLLSREELPDLE